jgi:hypothetical protein
MKDLHWNDGSVYDDPAKLKLEFTLQLVATGTRGSVNANGAGHPDRSPLPAGQPGSPDLWSPPVNGLIPSTAAASAAERRGISWLR